MVSANKLKIKINVKQLTATLPTLASFNNKIAL